MQKEADLKKEADKSNGYPYKDHKGHLTKRIGRRPHKFCCWCALMIEAEQKKLIRHKNGHH